ncbi:hypothetical protein [Candidatus Korobacter versatilis]|uniref:hypothetical protein n=1 Tax=Candidatus Korobacter versatilis TaxID=658062 RepID=UPI0005A4AF69|nr:hypothetical protein [Candidatus Koribacter versatilis]
MDKIPFSVYDFFAYLSSGATVLAAFDYVSGLHILERTQVGVALGVLLVVLSYVVGQIVAHFSSFILEQLVVSRILTRPTDLLLAEGKTKGLRPLVFPNYFRPLPKETQIRVWDAADRRKGPAKGEGLFLHAYAVVTRNDKAQARLDEFRNQYGFARNMAFALLFDAIVIAVQRVSNPTLQWHWALAAAFCGIALFYRYLKFFRQYSYELLLRYAELPLGG